jgi:O-antigen/teichoic acid export membrane protein
LSISILKKNLAANLVGNGWAALMGVILIPLYINFLGIESWGLMGIFASLQGICALLDMGLSATLNREMARLSVREDKAQEMRNLVRTLELIYWAVALVIGVSIFALAPLIANHWVQASQLSPETIEHAIRMMGLALSLQWPFGLYSGGLLGLQRQVLLSGINITIATLRGGGAILILWKVSPTLQAFFSWQALISLLQTCLTGWFLWRSLPQTQIGAGFQSTLLRGTSRFAAGMSGITVMSVILTQMDKIILSRLLTLKMFGYYVLAGAVTTSIYLLVQPVFSALYPRFTQLVSLGDEAGLKQLYHHSCQLMSVLILPASMVIASFSREILFLWTGDSTTAANTHLVLTVLIIGTALNGLMHLPYALQLAYGWTKLAFYVNLVAVLILAPSLISMASLYGAVGAAFIWVILNSGFALIVIQLLHRRLLKGEQWRWYFEDVGLPLSVSLGTAFLCSVLAPRGGPQFQLLMVLAGATIFVTGSTFLATPVTRLALVGYFRSCMGRFSNVS